MRKFRRARYFWSKTKALSGKRCPHSKGTLRLEEREPTHGFLSKTFTLSQDSLPRRQSCYGSYRLVTEGGSRELLVSIVEQGQVRRLKTRGVEADGRIKKPLSEGNEGAEKLSK